VGGRLEVFSRAFELMDADEYTLTYMENNKHIFVMADADAILESLRVQVRGGPSPRAASRAGRALRWPGRGGTACLHARAAVALGADGASRSHVWRTRLRCVTSTFGG
jgi:hypothetical protein